MFVYLSGLAESPVPAEAELQLLPAPKHLLRASAHLVGAQAQQKWGACSGRTTPVAGLEGGEAGRVDCIRLPAVPQGASPDPPRPRPGPAPGGVGRGVCGPLVPRRWPQSAAPLPLLPPGF